MVFLRPVKRLADVFMRRWYSFINRADIDGVLHFMNYGYQDSERPALEPADEPNRYPIQLYHHTASFVDLSGKDLLEVGCGRGGGLSYVSRYLRPGTATGVDLNPEAIEFCSASWPGISFRVMDAQALDFPDETFDAVVNVESSHRYPDFASFVREVFRVLRPGGHLLFTDFRYARLIDPMVETLEAVGFLLLRRETINDQVLAALRADSARRVEMIAKYLPAAFRGAALEFAGTPGTGLYRSFERGRRVYVCMALQKPVARADA